MLHILALFCITGTFEITKSSCKLLLTLVISLFFFFAGMTLAGKAYFDAVSKIGENAIVSPVSRELGEFHTSPVPVSLYSVKYERRRAGQQNP